MSVATPPSGITAELMVVKGFDELEANADKVKGKIVLFNVEFTQYAETVRYRGAGPSRAARHGAVAMLVRAVGPIGLRTPHTGATRYDEELPKIPAASVAAEDANRLQRLVERGRRVVLKLQMEAQLQGEAESANLIGELRGRELPNEVVLVGGHMDSWDVGTGAMDDGGGVVAAWEALRMLKKLGLRPRRRCAWSASPTRRTAARARSPTATRTGPSCRTTCSRSSPTTARSGCAASR
jgi:carboxypeptidase Q